jgi:hypothetical protein
MFCSWRLPVANAVELKQIFSLAPVRYRVQGAGERIV